MILVTVGTQFFDELVIEADRLAGAGAFGEGAFAQIGLSKYQPRHMEFTAFDRDLIARAREASLIITHAGTGCVCEMIEVGRPFIAVVNDTKAGNHQLEFLRDMSTRYDFCWISSPGELEAALRDARPARPLGEPGIDRLADDLRAWLTSACYNPAAKNRSRAEWTSPLTYKRTPAC